LKKNKLEEALKSKKKKRTKPKTNKKWRTQLSITAQMRQQSGFMAIVIVLTHL
jgi:predicted lipoprotein